MLLVIQTLSKNYITNMVLSIYLERDLQPTPFYRTNERQSKNINRR